mgnify:CR=1 FL=1
MPEASTVIIFISLGFILLLIEMFTPGFSIPGISGIVLLVMGCYKAFALSPFWGIFVSVSSLLLVVGFFKLFQRSPLWRKIRLDTKETKAQGFSCGEDLSGLLNKSGVTASILRPSGIALIDGKRIDVIAESLFIDKDKKVNVVKVEGNKVIVKEE